jgi:hypothetical protein
MCREGQGLPDCKYNYLNNTVDPYPPIAKDSSTTCGGPAMTPTESNDRRRRGGWEGISWVAEG